MSDYQNDIEKYLKGELTPSQMHALEKRALDDPFLADALEGAEQLSSQDLTADLNLLNEALNKRLHPAKNGWLWPMRIAAGLMLVAVSSYLIISLNKQDRSKELAFRQERETAPSAEKQEISPLVADSVVLEYKSPLDQAQESDQAENKNTRAGSETPPLTPSTSSPTHQSLALADKPVAAEEEKPPLKEESEHEISADVSAEERVASTPVDKPLAGRQEVVKMKKDSYEEAEVMRSKSIAGDAAKAEANDDKVARRIVRGKVTFSEDGTGLPGVNVIVKGSNQGTVTDGQGNYVLSLPEADASLTFSFIGFTSKDVDANANELNVQLDTDISELNEVEVVGYPMMQDGPLVPNPPPVMELAAPAGGRKLFKQYLEQNLQYPKQAIANQIEGKVTIQFSIGATGQLSDFRVLRGIGYGCDEEVIRLVQQGPKWAPTKKDDVAIRDKAKVRIKFALNKKK